MTSIWGPERGTTEAFYSTDPQNPYLVRHKGLGRHAGKPALKSSTIRVKHKLHFKYADAVTLCTCFKNRSNKNISAVRTQFTCCQLVIYPINKQLSRVTNSCSRIISQPLQSFRLLTAIKS